MLISIAKDFSDVPWGRYPSDGDVCGQIFREKFLVEPIKRGEKIMVSLDGVEGLGSSFLDEAFAGLVRTRAATEDQLRAQMEIVTSQREFQMYIDLVWRYVRQAEEELHRDLVRA
jgi:hypothetical protein